MYPVNRLFSCAASILLVIFVTASYGDDAETPISQEDWSDTDTSLESAINLAQSVRQRSLRELLIPFDFFNHNVG